MASNTWKVKHFQQYLLVFILWYNNSCGEVENVEAHLEGKQRDATSNLDATSQFGTLAQPFQKDFCSHLCLII